VVEKKAAGGGAAGEVLPVPTAEGKEES